MIYDKNTLVEAQDLVIKGCCPKATSYFKEKNKKTLNALFKECITKQNFDDAKWALIFLMDKSQRIEWAVWCKKKYRYFNKNFPKDRKKKKLNKKYLSNLENKKTFLNIKYANHVSISVNQCASSFSSLNSVNSGNVAKDSGVHIIKILEKGFEILVNARFEK